MIILSQTPSLTLFNVTDFPAVLEMLFIFYGSKVFPAPIINMHTKLPLTRGRTALVIRRRTIA